MTVPWADRELRDAMRIATWRRNLCPLTLDTLHKLVRNRRRRIVVVTELFTSRRSPNAHTLEYNRLHEFYDRINRCACSGFSRSGMADKQPGGRSRTLNKANRLTRRVFPTSFESSSFLHESVVRIRSISVK